MNIRRGFLALAAMILGVGFLGALPQQAQAQTITCTITDTTGPDGNNVWPFNSNVTACTGTTELAAMQHGLYAVYHQYQRVRNGVVVGVGPQLKALNPRVFLFNSPAD